MQTYAVRERQQERMDELVNQEKAAKNIQRIFIFDKR